MGLIKSFLLVIVSSLLFVSFFAGNLFLTLSWSLEYQNVEAQFTSSMKELLTDQIDLVQVMAEQIPFMESYCQNNSEFVFQEPTTNYTFQIPCTIVSQGPDSIVEYGSQSFLKDLYYKEYNCGFWDCFGETQYPLFLISEKAKNYWNGKFYFTLMISLALIGLMFFLVHKKTSLLIIPGSLLVASSLPFMKLDSVLTFFSGKPFISFLSVFFTQSYSVFLASLIAGIILLAAGILFKIFGIGFKISSLFSKKENPKPIKKEMPPPKEKPIPKKKTKSK